MVLPSINTQRLKLLLRVKVDFKYPFDLQITGIDDRNRRTVFFERLANPGKSGSFILDFLMPLTPENLRMFFQNASNGDETAYAITAISADYLPQALVALTPDEKEFSDFYQWFCVNASYLPDGIYRSRTGKYWINYMEDIVDDQLGKIQTPARIDHETREMQISSRQFRTFTVPIRIVIGWHEYFHTALNTTDEIVCDMNALRVVLGQGFPQSECLYAFTNIFNDNKQGRQRIARISNFINGFKYNNTYGRL